MELNIKYKTDMIKFLDLQKVTAKYAEEIHEAVLRVVIQGGIYKAKKMQCLKHIILHILVLNIL